MKCKTDSNVATYKKFCSHEKLKFTDQSCFKKQQFILVLISLELAISSIVKIKLKETSATCKISVVHKFPQNFTSKYPNWANNFLIRLISQFKVDFYEIVWISSRTMSLKPISLYLSQDITVILWVMVLSLISMCYDFYVFKAGM